MGLAAAAGAAIAGATIAGALETVAVVGAVLGVVGTITKSPILSKVGLGLGIVGGVGALAAGALGVGSTQLFGTQITESAADAAGSTAANAAGTVASDAAGAAGNAAPDAIGQLSGVGDAANAAADPAGLIGVPPAPPGGVGAIGADGQVITAPATGLGTDGLSFTPTGVDGSELAGQDAAAVQGRAAAAAASGTNDTQLSILGQHVPGTAQDGSGLSIQANPELNTSGPAAESLPQAASTPNVTEAGPLTGDSGSGIGGFLGKTVDYASAHPVIAFGALQGVSSLLSGWTSSLTPAQVAAYNAQAANNQAAANLTNQQAANLAQPKAVATSTPVTGTPQQLVPNSPGPGFINQQAMQLVTGKVAA